MGQFFDCFNMVLHLFSGTDSPASVKSILMYIDYVLCISSALHQSYTLEGTKISLSSSSKHESLRK